MRYYRREECFYFNGLSKKKETIVKWAITLTLIVIIVCSLVIDISL